MLYNTQRKANIKIKDFLEKTDLKNQKNMFKNSNSQKLRGHFEKTLDENGDENEGYKINHCQESIVL